MRIDILTLFPEMFAPLHSSILKRAQDRGLLEIFLHNIRDYADNKHKSTDDYPYGGGAGMVMMVQPVFDCMDAVIAQDEREALCIYLSPGGETLRGGLAQELAEVERMLLLCGHYEGIDERILTRIDRQISIGDYVLTGGELPAMVLVDCVSRFLPDVLGSHDSAWDESFSDGLLEYPQYTRPADFRGLKAPEILLGGHHAKIQRWRREEALRTTREKRPDLLEKAPLSAEDAAFLQKLAREDAEGN